MQPGLTVWRLRLSGAADGGARIIVHHEGETEEWTPERVESNTPLRMGERIRFSFESPQTIASQSNQGRRCWSKSDCVTAEQERNHEERIVSVCESSAALQLSQNFCKVVGNGFHED